MRGVPIFHSLKKWEVDINRLSRENVKLLVENKTDLEGPPTQMQYGNQNKPAEGIVIPDDPIVGCECPEGQCHTGNCCPSNADAPFPYNRFGKICVRPGTPIYECNKRCQCGPSCCNRVVQKGRKVSSAS